MLAHSVIRTDTELIDLFTVCIAIRSFVLKPDDNKAAGKWRDMIRLAPQPGRGFLITIEPGTAHFAPLHARPWLISDSPYQGRNQINLY
jgi:hypothetical protein